MNTTADRRGTVLSVNISPEKGMKKHNIDTGLFLEGTGLQDDAHAGMEIRQVSLLAKESIEKIRAKGLNVGFGDFAENLTTEGIVFHELPIGTRFSVGNSVILELSQIGKVCHSRCAIYRQVGDCVMPREGVFAVVVNGGEIKVGDDIRIL